MENGASNTCVLEVPHGAHAALHCLQGIASNMPDTYESVHFPFYGGSSRMGTLFLTRKLPDSRKVPLSIQQTSETRLETFLIGKSSGSLPVLCEMIAPLLAEYRANYPMCEIVRTGV